MDMSGVTVQITYGIENEDTECQLFRSIRCALASYFASTI